MKRFNRKAFAVELALARAHMAQRDLDAATYHLERAHLIGQAYVWPHIVSHWHLSRVEWRRKNAQAVLGQMVRMLLGGVGSAVGVVPTGNTGGSNISMFKRMPVDEEMQRILNAED
ncbi:MAG: DUF3703 domain-containing protein [Gammaproteobacteria bacterium]|mgnify:CR=1 FL=1|jgi:hypothetical protein|nr:DUF3703 domain-containing protein [Gammaproteobacteria bacterium]MBQ0774425.1 DUF3703 domain-containing protein [Gammaproteobacteria bacterium]|tara:strand:- start:71246 stop:71593 length:348 start_codon:yes stop_codon:yes gene_type:complete